MCCPHPLCLCYVATSLLLYHPIKFACMSYALLLFFAIIRRVRIQEVYVRVLEHPPQGNYNVIQQSLKYNPPAPPYRPWPTTGCQWPS